MTGSACTWGDPSGHVSGSPAPAPPPALHTPASPHRSRAQLPQGRALGRRRLEGHMTVTTFEAAFGVAAGTHSLLHPLIHGLPFPSAVRGTDPLNRPHFTFARGLPHVSFPSSGTEREDQERRSWSSRLLTASSCRCGVRAAPPAPDGGPCCQPGPPRPPCCPPTGEIRISLAAASTWTAVGTLVHPLTRACLLGAPGLQFRRAQRCEGGKAKLSSGRWEEWGAEPPTRPPPVPKPVVLPIALKY